MPPHPLTSFEIQKYYQNERGFNGDYSRDNLPKTVKDGAYVINLDEYKDVLIGVLCIVKILKLFISTVLQLNMFLKKLKNLLGIKAVQSNNSIMCGYFCIRFIDFMFAGKPFIDFTSLFSPHDFEKNDNIILSYFENE